MIKLIWYDYNGKNEVISVKPDTLQSLIYMLEDSKGVSSWYPECLENEYPFLQKKFYNKWN